MSLTLVVNSNPYGTGSDETQHSQILTGAAVFTAMSYIVGGIAISWAALKTGSASGGAFMPQSSATAPYKAKFWSEGGSGYDYQWNKATSKLQIFLGGVELTAIALPAAVIADLIAMEAWYIKA